MSASAGTTVVEGHYDIRKGAAAYAPIIGAFGALAVPAITVLFTTSKAQDSTLITFAAGLLVVAMIGSLTGSIALAAIGAEQDETANLPAAVMFVAVPVVISMVAVLAAFEILSAIYLPASKTLFAVMTGVGGLAGTYFTSLAVGDSWHTGPSDPVAKKAWQSTQWIKGIEDSYRKANYVAGLSSVPAFIGVVLRLCGAELFPTPTNVNWLVGVGLAAAMVGTFLGVQRTLHAIDGVQRGIRAPEAYGTALAVSSFTLAVITFLP